MLMNLNKLAAYVCLSDVPMSLCESQLEVSAVNTFPSSRSIKENAKQRKRSCLRSNTDTQLLLRHSGCAKLHFSHNKGNISPAGWTEIAILTFRCLFSSISVEKLQFVNKLN